VVCGIYSPHDQIKNEKGIEGSRKLLRYHRRVKKCNATGKRKRTIMNTLVSSAPPEQVPSDEVVEALNEED
jgi:hypothetical protein